MRWFVELASAPRAHAPPGTAHAQPPGPGFPLHAPSVYTTVRVVRVPTDGGLGAGTDGSRTGARSATGGTGMASFPKESCCCIRAS